MKKTGTTIIIAVSVAFGAAMISVLVYAVLSFFGYKTPIERMLIKWKTDATLENRYPGHDFDIKSKFGSSEYGYYFNMHATDENGVEFLVQWVDGSLEDHYHDEWNRYYYGEKIVEYQNSLREKYFPQIPYVDTYEYYPYDTYEFKKGSFKEVFFESLDDAIEGSKDNAFDTEVTFKGIDLDTANDEEIQMFAESIADSLLWLYDETGYYDIRINNFYYRVADEYDTGFKTKEELADSIIKQIEVEKKIRQNRKDAQ